nr:autotransporter assembly complex family protein [Tamilnaduibacter salinus]
MVCIGLLCGLLAVSAMAAGQVRVKVNGDHPALERNANTYLGEVTGRSADNLRRYASHAADEVARAVRALGYYQPDISWRVESNGLAQLILTVDPGPTVIIQESRVEIRGPASSDPGWPAIDTSAIGEGQTLHHGDYNQVRDSIRSQGRRLGYFDGQLTEHRMIVNPEAGTARLTLIYESGPRYRFGTVSFQGGHEFDDDLLSGYVPFKRGDPYDADVVADLNSHLSNSGYFSRVIVDPRPQISADQSVPVVVNLRARDPRSVSAGVGFSTDVGPRFRGDWTEHWINQWGHKRGVETEISQPRQSLSTWYELPLDPPMTDSIRLNAGYQREDIEDVASDRLVLGQQWQHELSSGWQQVLSLKWQGERYRIGQRRENRSTLLLPGISYSKLNADNPIDPSRGFRLVLDVAGSHRAVLSDADILHVRGLARGLITLADRHRFLARVEAGAVATNDFEDVPPSLRFFAGGDQSVRGYGYETLAPEGADGETEGGRYLLATSVEYQYEFSPAWRVATFYDEGNAVNSLNDRLASGYGVGLRWVSPVGPIRLDVARGLDPSLGGGWRLHFSMGPEL